MSENEIPLSPAVEEKLSELAILQQSVVEAQAKAADYYDQLLRLKAEFENYRKRVEKEKIDARHWGKQEVLMTVISFVDVFEQAMAQAKTAKEMAHVIQGLEFLQKNFHSFLKAEGIQEIETVGKLLNPMEAEAVDQQEVEEGLTGQVIAEIQKGYKFGDRVLRTSRVRVGVAKKTPEENKA